MLKKKRVLTIIGTRPEAIKMGPVILALKKCADFEVVVCNTEQQKQLAAQALDLFGVESDINLDVMTDNQTLPELQSRLLTRLSPVMAEGGFDAAIAQGDTMTVFCSALMAFYNKIPFFHVEAGLRSYDLEHPFPEEMIRQCVSRIAALNFAPTDASLRALLSESVPDQSIKVTGNTVIDALLMFADRPFAWDASRLADLNPEAPMVLVTVHRRENHGSNLREIVAAVADLARSYKRLTFVLPVHPNPNVRSYVETELGSMKNIAALAPLDYPELVQIMRRSKLILTDSGGIQEEAPTFGVPILVMRERTERMEGVIAGYAEMVGSDRQRIVARARAILDGTGKHKRAVRNPYGDGTASAQIVRHVRAFLADDAKGRIPLPRDAVNMGVQL